MNIIDKYKIHISSVEKYRNNYYVDEYGEKCEDKYEGKREDKYEGKQSSQTFVKTCGRSCYIKFHPVDEEKVKELAHQYSITNKSGDPLSHYYKALNYLRSQVFCENKKNPCCNYWKCATCTKERYPWHVSRYSHY